MNDIYVEAPNGCEDLTEAVEYTLLEDGKVMRLGFLTPTGQILIHDCAVKSGTYYGFNPLFRPTRTQTSPRVWVSNRLNYEDEAAAKSVLERKYKHVITCRNDSDLLDEAQRICRRDYYADVNSTAESIRDDVLSGDIEDADELEQRIHETIDGASRVIYTHEAIQCVLHSDHNNAAFEDELLPAESYTDGIPWSSIAYYAFKADVEEKLEELGVDASKRDLGVAAMKDEEEEENDG